MQLISVLAVLILIIGCALPLDATLAQQWEPWKDSNKKQYSDAEEHIRYAKGSVKPVGIVEESLNTHLLDELYGR